MKAPVLLFALALATPAAAAVRVHHVDGCGVESRYDLALDASRLAFTRADATPQRIELERGHLRIDGREVAVSEADRRRLAEVEAGLRALAPQMRAIARDAVDIAYTAIGEVARAFAGERSTLADTLERRHADARARVDDAFASRPFDDKAIGAVVDATVEEVMPALASDMAAVAVKALLSGDEAMARDLESRTAQLDAQIEARVETQARQIEARAKALCPQFAQLAELQDSLDLRLPDGGRLELLGVRR